MKKSLIRSQKAHERLHNFHYGKMAIALSRKDRASYDMHFRKDNYHQLCVVRQDQFNRTLTKAEKKKVYDDVKAIWG